MRPAVADNPSWERLRKGVQAVTTEAQQDFDVEDVLVGKERGTLYEKSMQIALLLEVSLSGVSSVRLNTHASSVIRRSEV